MKLLKSFLLTLTAVFILQLGADALTPETSVSSEDAADIEALIEPTDEADAEAAPVEADALKRFFMSLSAETKSDEVEALAKEYGLFASYRNYGTATYGYRIAAAKDVADVNTKAKGSFASISFYILQNDAVTEISCFDMDTMTEAFWYPDRGYFVVDYNVPQTAVFSAAEDGTEKRSCMIPVDSAQEALDYVSVGNPDGNLLARLFLSAHEGMTEEEILTFVNDNDMAYSEKGPGNFKTIAYTEDVAEKYGKNGTVITFDTDDAGLIWMQYSYYPAAYRQDISAAFYSRSFAASRKTEEGFLLCRTGSKPAQYKDVSRLIQLIHGER